MLRPRELAERRATKLEELRGILAAGDDVGDEARARFDALKGEIETLDADLARAEFLAQAERRMAAGTAQPQDPLDVELRGYSVLRAIAAQVPGLSVDAGREREVSQELQRRSGRRHEGLTLPLAALEKRVVTTAAPAAGPGGNLIATDHRADLFIEPLRSRLVVRRLGARVLGGLVGNLEIPRLTKSATGAWVAENAPVPLSDPEFDKVTLAPKHVGGRVELSRNMLQQTSPDVEQLVRNDLAAVLARAIDAAAINGGGANEPEGVLQTTGIGSVSFATPGWAQVLEFLAAIETADAAEGTLAWLTHPSVLPTLANTLKVTGDAGGGWLADAPDRMAGYQLVTSTLVPTDLGAGTDKAALVLGAWSELVIGYWSELDILVNPYESSAYAKGNVQLRAMATCDVAVRNPEAFAAAVDV